MLPPSDKSLSCTQVAEAGVSVHGEKKGNTSEPDQGCGHPLRSAYPASHVREREWRMGASTAAPESQSESPNVVPFGLQVRESTCLMY